MIRLWTRRSVPEASRWRFPVVDPDRLVVRFDRRVDRVGFDRQFAALVVIDEPRQVAVRARFGIEQTRDERLDPGEVAGPRRPVDGQRSVPVPLVAGLDDRREVCAVVDVQVADEHGLELGRVDPGFREAGTDPAPGVKQESRLAVHVHDVAGVRSAVAERGRSRSEDGDRQRRGRFGVAARGGTGL